MRTMAFRMNLRVYILVLRYLTAALLCAVSMVALDRLHTTRRYRAVHPNFVTKEPMRENGESALSSYLTDTTTVNSGRRIMTASKEMKKTPSSKPTKPPDHVTSRSSQTSSKQTTIAHEDIIIKRNPFNWTIVEKDFCTKRFPNTTILVVLHTAIEHYERRQIYRDMYGEQLYEQYGIAMLFVLGTSNNGDKKERILEESSTYHDIIQQDFLDAYRNLTWKALAWLRFVDEYCATARYVLKIDDDVVFDAIGLLKYLHIDERNSTEIKNENRIICGLFQGTNLVPVRKKGSKWYVTKEEYQPDFYYPYCRGIQFLLSPSTATAILNASIGEKFFWIDDYFITGYLGHKINVTFDNIRPLQATKEKFLERKALFWWVNKGDMREAKKLWNKLELSYEVEQAVKKALKESRQNCNGTSSTTSRPAPK